MQKMPEILSDMRDKLNSLLLESGVENPTPITEKWVHWLRRDYGGQQHYIPRGHQLDCDSEYWDIYGQFTGSNYHQLAQHFQKSEQWIRLVIQRCRKVLQGTEQVRLFE